MNRYRERYEGPYRDTRRDEAEPFGVGSDAAYGAPRRRRPSDRVPEERWSRHFDADWEDHVRYSDPHPGHHREVPGEITENQFWAPRLDNPVDDRLTGAELRRYQQGFHPDYVNWREDQLRAHDRDYHAWREERRRSYDDDYHRWRSARRRGD